MTLEPMNENPPLEEAIEHLRHLSTKPVFMTDRAMLVVIDELASVQSRLERLEAMLGQATKISFEETDVLLPDLELMCPSDGKWYYALDATLFCETPYPTALEAYEAACKYGEDGCK